MGVGKRIIRDNKKGRERMGMGKGIIRDNNKKRKKERKKERNTPKCPLPAMQWRERPATRATPPQQYRHHKVLPRFNPPLSPNTKEKKDKTRKSGRYEDKKEREKLGKLRTMFASDEKEKEKDRGPSVRH